MLFAETATQVAEPGFMAYAGNFLAGMFAAAVFGVIGIALLIAGYYAFEGVTRKLDVQDELKKGNVAVAIVTGSLLFSIAYIASHVVR
jgi:putative membrane protein